MLCSAAVARGDLHLTNEYVCPVGAGDVVEHTGYHVSTGLRLRLARFGIGVVDRLGACDFPGRRVERVKADAAVEVRRAPGGEPAFSIVQEHAARHGPG